MDQTVLKRLPEVLLPWYEKNKRQLPWRQDRDPYHVWVSEIMLQQTRVEAVKGYYTRFLETLPSVEKLASCDDQLLHKLWEGLGYYSRVRNMKKAAQILVSQYAGRFPTQYEQVRTLPGVGDYTAGAICSICFDMPKAAVDGNVLRIAARLTDDATPVELATYKNQIRQQLEAVYPAQAGAFTQALMELGATVCGPNQKPACEDCPCASFCLGRQKGHAEALPVRLPKKAKRREEKTVFILRCEDSYALLQRKESGLLAGLWQFPDTAGILEIQPALAYLERSGLKVTEIYKQLEKNHVFTHVKWDMRGIYVEVKEQTDAFVWYTAEQIDKAVALPTAYRQFWQAR